MRSCKHREVSITAEDCAKDGAKNLGVNASINMSYHEHTLPSFHKRPRCSFFPSCKISTG